MQEDKTSKFFQVFFKEIDLVQGCINRMAANSFEIKKWTVGLIAILGGLIEKSSVKQISGCLIFIMIIGVFWYLDAYFLKTERLYRAKYNWIIKKRAEVNLDNLFDLDPHNMAMVENKDKEISIWAAMKSETLRYFYGGLIGFCIVIYLLS